jgi:hypothetical protein
MIRTIVALASLLVCTAPAAHALSWDDLVWVQASHVCFRQHSDSAALQKEATARKFAAACSPLYSLGVLIKNAGGKGEDLASVPAARRAQLLVDFQLALIEPINTGLAHAGKDAATENPGFSLWQLGAPLHVLTASNMTFGIAEGAGTSAHEVGFLKFHYRPTDQHGHDAAKFGVADWIVNWIEARGAKPVTTHRSQSVEALASGGSASATAANSASATTVTSTSSGPTSAEVKADEARLQPLFNQNPVDRSHKPAIEAGCLRLNKYRLFAGKATQATAEQLWANYIAFCDKFQKGQIRLK